MSNKLTVIGLIKGIAKFFSYREFVGKSDVDNKNDGFYMSPNNYFEIDAAYMIPISLFNEVLYIKFTEAHAIEFADTWNNF
jgi:hypothetical protein